MKAEPGTVQRTKEQEEMLKQHHAAIIAKIPLYKKQAAAIIKDMAQEIGVKRTVTSKELGINVSWPANEYCELAGTFRNLVWALAQADLDTRIAFTDPEAPVPDVAFWFLP